MSASANSGLTHVEIQGMMEFHGNTEKSHAPYGGIPVCYRRAFGLFAVWILFGALMLAGFVVGVVLVVLSWFLLPLIRYFHLRRRNAFASSWGVKDPSGGVFTSGLAHGELIEGDYEVRSRRG